MLEKNFCFLGFPNTARSLGYLCREVNQYILAINNYFFNEYHISGRFTPPFCVDNNLGPAPILNTLHNHFERLQGTVDNLSEYYLRADFRTKYAIRQLNNICHEMESLILSQRKQKQDPHWIRPSQITTWLTASRYQLTDEHRQGFVTNGYDRVFGGVYMHWAQIGKTYFEVWRDEQAPELNDTVCEAITALEYYSGEFDIEWGRDITQQQDWWSTYLTDFYNWLERNGVDAKDPRNSLGYLPIAQVDLQRSFGTTNVEEIWKLLESHLDIYAIEVDGIRAEYPEVWSDPDYTSQQIEKLQAGYQHGTQQ